MPCGLEPDLERVFVKKVEPANENLVNKMARAIVTKLVDCGHTKPSPELCKKAAKKAARTFSPLKVKGDDDSVSMTLTVN